MMNDTMIGPKYDYRYKSLVAVVTATNLDELRRALDRAATMEAAAHARRDPDRAEITRALTAADDFAAARHGFSDRHEMAMALFCP